MLDNSELRNEQLQDLFRAGAELNYAKGEYIIRPGESPSGVFYINNGIVKAYDITKYGEENLLIIRKPQEIFPLIWAITGQERDIIYQAMSDVFVYKIDREALISLIEVQPSALKSILSMTVEMYRVHSERIINLEYRSVRERLISFLLTTSQRFGVEYDNQSIIELPLRHQDIASSINASRETASREISLLEKRGLIETGSNIILRDLTKLREYL